MTYYSDQKLDELTGGLLQVGKLHALLGGILDVTAEKDHAVITTHIRHMPNVPARMLSVSLRAAMRGTVSRLNELMRELNKLDDELIVRFAQDDAEAKKVKAEFDEMLSEAFGDEAKKNGLV